MSDKRRAVRSHLFQAVQIILDDILPNHSTGDTISDDLASLMYFRASARVRLPGVLDTLEEQLKNVASEIAEDIIQMRRMSPQELAAELHISEEDAAKMQVGEWVPKGDATMLAIALNICP